MDGVVVCMLWPQLLQKALPAGTSLWHAIQVRVDSCEGVVLAATD